MAVTVTVTVNRAYDAIMGNKRETGGTFIISGSYDGAAVIVTSNTLGLKQAEFFEAVGGTTLTYAPVVGVGTINISGVALNFQGPVVTTFGQTVSTTGTVITQTYNWRARGY